MFLTASFQEWFLGLVADSMAELETMVVENQSAQQKFQEHILERELAWYKSKGLAAPKPPAEAENRAKKIIDEFFSKSEMIHNLQGLVDAATRKKPDGDKYPVSRSSVSRIYNGAGAGAATRQMVASVINEVVPCHKDDLTGTESKK